MTRKSRSLNDQLAEAMSMERSDDFLGDGWIWSSRHVKAVESSSKKMRVRRDKLMFDMKNVNKAAMSVSGWDNTAYPFFKMVLITHFPEAEKELTETFVNG